MLKHLPIFLYPNRLRLMFCTIAILVVVVAATIVPCHIVVTIALFVVILVVVEGFWFDFGRCFGLDVVMIGIVLKWCQGCWRFGRNFCRGLWFRGGFICFVAVPICD